MPKRITILDPNGVELVETSAADTHFAWEGAANLACNRFRDLLKRQNPKLGTYTVTVKETGDD